MEATVLSSSLPSPCEDNTLNCLAILCHLTRTISPVAGSVWLLVVALVKTSTLTELFSGVSSSSASKGTTLLNFRRPLTGWEEWLVEGVSSLSTSWSGCRSSLTHSIIQDLVIKFPRVLIRWIYNNTVKWQGWSIGRFFRERVYLVATSNAYPSSCWSPFYCFHLFVFL